LAATRGKATTETLAARDLRHIFILIIAILVLAYQLPVTLSQETGIIVSNGKTRIIESIPAILTGDVLVEKNSTLIMRNVRLQLSIRGEKSYNITVRDRSTLVLRKSIITSLHSASNMTIGDSSTLVVEEESSISGFQSLKFENSSLASLQSSTLGIGYVVGSTDKLQLSHLNAVGTAMDVSSPSASIETTALRNLYLHTAQLNARSLRVTDLRVQCARATLSDIQAQIADVHATGQVYASGVRATTSNIHTTANATITDSIFGTLTVGLRGQLHNVTTSRSPLIRAGGMIYTHSNSTVKRYWNLKVNVTDITELPVPATIEIRDHNMTLVDSARVGVDGTVSKPVLSEIITNSIPTFIGNYRVSAHYRNHVTKIVTIVLDTNKRVDLVFPDEIPGLASVTTEITPQLILTGDKVTVRGKIRVPMKDMVVELTYVTPDGSKLTRAAITNKDGEFTDELRLDMAGKWRLHAYWLGGELYSEGVAPMSRPVGFQVLARQSVLDMIVLMVPILVVLTAAIIGLALLLLRHGGTSRVLRPSRSKRGQLIARMRRPNSNGMYSRISTPKVYA